MTQLTKQPLATRGLGLGFICDICGKKRSAANHSKCSRKRQKLAQEIRS